MEHMAELVYNRALLRHQQQEQKAQRSKCVFHSASRVSQTALNDSRTPGLLQYLPHTASSAAARSAIRSSASSMPTDIRINASVIPKRSRVCLATPECVVLAGCDIKVSVPPRLTASLITCSASSSRKASASPPLTAKPKVEPALPH